MSQGLEQTNRQWDVDVPFQTDLAEWHDIRGVHSRDITASCFEFAYSDTAAQNLQMSGGETMTFVGFAHREYLRIVTALLRGEDVGLRRPRLVGAFGGTGRYARAPGARPGRGAGPAIIACRR